MLALKDMLWIREVLSDLNLLLPGPSMMWCDSKSAVAMAFDPVAFKNTKHILRAAEFLKHHTLCGSVTIKHAKGVIMIADILTKGQARPIFLQLLKLLDDYSENSIIDNSRTNTQYGSDSRSTRSISSHEGLGRHLRCRPVNVRV